MQQGLTTPTQAFKPDYIYWVKHYVGLFWRWKWYILPTLPVLVVTWMLLVLTFGKVRPELTVHALLGIGKPPSGLVLDPTAGNLGRLKLIQSRNFLSEIVDSLSLNVVLPKYDRSKIFNLVMVDSNVIPGQYRFTIDKQLSLNYTITLTNKSMELNRKVISTGRLPSLDTIKTTGMTLSFSPQYLTKPFNFDFYVLPKYLSIEKLRDVVTVEGSKSDPMMEGVIVIGVSGPDRQLISKIVNLIADRFVEKNLSFRKRNSHDILKALQVQLQTASAQLIQDENRLRAFKEENPKIGLGIDAQNAISSITTLESKDMTISNVSSEANDILQRLQLGDPSNQITSEALLFLSSRQISSAMIMQKDFNNLLQEKASLIADRYSADHPMVKEVQDKIDEIKMKTVPLMNGFLKKQENEIVQTKAQKTQSLNQLRGLPQKEMQLANLTRQQQINADIYSTILFKYNQAKLADETEIADIYIMDYSVPPEEASVKKALLTLLGIGLVVCLLLTFGPAAIFDLFDKRVRSEEDLKRFMLYPLLETIPVLTPAKQKSSASSTPYLRKVDQKLLEIGPQVTHIHELFRSLRAKINYRLELVHGKSFMVTGYDSGDGKSLLSANIAIMAAQQHIPTLLIDGDMRRGVLHETFAVDNQPGLSDLLLSDVQITEQMIRSTIKPTSFSHLFLLSCGTQIENSTELLTRPRFKGIMQWINARFAIVIIDSPPISPVTDPVIISSMVSGALVVVRAGKTNTAGLNRVINEYPTFKEKIIGMVLNGVKDDPKRKKYNAYYYHTQTRKNEQLLLTSQRPEGKV